MVTLVSLVPSTTPNYVTPIHHRIRFLKHRLYVCLHTRGERKGFYAIHPAIHTNFFFGTRSYIIYMYVPVCSLIAFSRTEFLKLVHFETRNKVPNSYLKYYSMHTHRGNKADKARASFQRDPHCCYWWLYVR